MTTAENLTPEEAHDSDADLQHIIDIWPRLPERVRWDIFMRVWWYVFKTDMKKLFKDLARLASVVVDTLKMRR